MAGIKKDRPRICLIDCSPELQATLKKQGFFCSEGTLGKPVSVPNKRYGDYVECLLSYSWPDNIHEYDVLIVDLVRQENNSPENYEHLRGEVKKGSQVILLSSYPDTLFDPRPAGAHVLGDLLKKRNFTREFVLIVFAGPQDIIEYRPKVKSAKGWHEDLPAFRGDIHDAIPGVSLSLEISGVDIKFVGDENQLSAVLRKYGGSYRYHVLFNFPKRWSGEEREYVDEDSFFPLMIAHEGLVASYFQFFKKGGVLVLPSCESQLDVVVDLLEEALPEFFPAVFPENAKFGWLSDPRYRIPGEAALLSEKVEIESNYKSAINDIEERIAKNLEDHSFLRQMLTESGDKLVASVAHYLEWLGFPEARIVDQESEVRAIKEEDIQVDFSDRLLVIEVKGLAGTSTDADCSQVSKIKYRRARERKRFDVLALYIVNHERFKPPESRRNPPFSKEQIEDALSDERGLLTTYQLFQLYFSIEDELITKEDARDALGGFGLVDFIPSAAELLGQPTELHYGNQVAILMVGDVSLCIGDSLIIRSGDKLLKTAVVELKVEGENVEFVSSGEVGIKVDQRISNGSQIWKPKSK